jgi:hypothetical protein
MVSRQAYGDVTANEHWADGQGAAAGHLEGFLEEYEATKF